MKFGLLRVSAIVLILMMALSLFTGCGGKDDPEPGVTTTKSTTTSTTESESAEEPVEVTLFLSGWRAGVPTDNYVVNKIQEMTNTKWNIIISTDEIPQLNTLIASGDIPDILTWGGEEYFTYQLIEDGLLVPLCEHIDKLPNLYEKKKDFWDNFKHSDGKVYFVSAFTDDAAGVDFVPAYRKDWLDNLGYDIPETMDEFIAVATAIAHGDPDNNGIDDTYALGGNDLRMSDLIYAGHGTLRDWWIEDEDGNAVYGSVHPNMREALRVANHLYEIGAIDPEFITDDWNRWKEKLAGVLGAGCIRTHIFDVNNESNYYEPFKSACPDGEWVYAPVPKGPGYREDINMRQLSPRGWKRNGIYSGTEKLDTCLMLMDWFNTDEGIMFNRYGEEGLHYVMEDDGSVRQLVTNVGEDENGVHVGIKLVFLASEIPFLHTSAIGQEAYAFARSLATPSAVDGILVEETALYELDLQEYTENEILKIILGEIPVDEGFDNMVSEFYRRGGRELTDAYNRARAARK
jgi:putative aldouronate transport system substrate-binding protein